MTHTTASSWTSEALKHDPRRKGRDGEENLREAVLGKNKCVEFTALVCTDTSVFTVIVTDSHDAGQPPHCDGEVSGSPREQVTARDCQGRAAGLGPPLGCHSHHKRVLRRAEKFFFLLNTTHMKDFG